MVIGLCLALLAGGVAVGWYADRARVDVSEQHHVPGGGGGGPTSPPEPGLSVRAPGSASLVLHGISRSHAVSARTIRRALGDRLRIGALGRHVAFAAAALGTGHRIVEIGSPATVTPASTTKLLTTTAALDLLGPSRRFVTRVVSGASHRRIVLVGGGDPLLTETSKTCAALASYPRCATLHRLAHLTAVSLRRAGRHRVRLSYNASLFKGPSVSPQWPSTYISSSVVSPVSALWVDEGRASPGLAQRVADPATVAAERFATMLRHDGVMVKGEIRAGSRPRHARALASVSSAPLAQIVQHILEVSDNDGAEVLLRQAAIGAGRSASFTGGVRAVHTTLTGLGIAMTGARFFDGSGLSRLDRVSVRTLVQVLQLDASPGHAELRAVIEGLPVAGFSGSLDDRFVYDAPRGLGVVRAKTGTLTGVSALAGDAITKRGTVIVFAVDADRIKPIKTYAARVALDRITAALASCRC